jgi:hypothetical protein
MKKRIKNIIKLAILIGVRQLWGLMCNLYLLAYQPFLTLRTIRGKRDKSQFLLLSTTVIAPAVFYVIARLTWDIYRYGHLLHSIGPVFWATTIIEAGIFSYLLYWTIRVIKKNHKDVFIETI